MSRPYKTLSSRVAWSCPWYQIRQDAILTPDGQEGVYNVVETSEAVWIIPVTPDGQIVLIYNYRYTVDDWCWELPAGSVKPGYSLEETAREELREETGGAARAWHHVHQFYTATGICNEVGHIFLATGVTLGTPQHESTEIMEIHVKPAAEVLHMARTLAIQDAPSALAILACEAQITQMG